MKESDIDQRTRVHLILSADPVEADADNLYGSFNDGTMATSEGVAQVQFHRQVALLEEAIRSAIGDIRSAGFDVERVELDPNSVNKVS